MIYAGTGVALATPIPTSGTTKADTYDNVIRTDRRTNQTVGLAP